MMIDEYNIVGNAMVQHAARCCRFLGFLVYSRLFRFFQKEISCMWEGDKAANNINMELNNNSKSFFFASSSAPLLLFLVIASLSASSASSSFISGDIFDSHASTGRNLLQAKKNCPVSFEFLNYTIITSQCKGPEYPQDLCCKSFKEIACPYTQELNDLTNDCSSIMFSYINRYGNYPEGLFANLCREGKEGLTCPATPPSTLQSDVSQTSPLHFYSASFLLFVNLVLLLLLL